MAASLHPRAAIPQKQRYNEMVMSSWNKRRRRSLLLLGLVVLVALIARANFVVPIYWQNPFDVHHLDEHFMPLEAVALWEGVTPRELGWPGSTTRLLLSAVYATRMVATEPQIRQELSNPAGVMEAIGAWSRARLDDRRELYVMGRWLSVIIGLLQVLVTYWAVKRWSSDGPALVAALLCATAPVAVSYSQFILADMTGLLCVTALMGLLADVPQRDGVIPRWFWAAVLMGLATASKYHFGIWLAPAMVGLWLTYERPTAERLRILVAFLCLFAGVHLLLVPWTWTNPVLIFKEFIGTVVTKVDREFVGLWATARHMAGALSGLGAMIIIMCVPGAIATWRRLRWRGAPLYLAAMLAVAIVAAAGELYDRYTLPLLPSAVLFCAIGTVRYVGANRRSIQAVACVVLLVVGVFTLRQLARSQAHVGQLDSYSRAHTWLLSHMRPGDRLGIDSLYPEYLPRAHDQLDAMVAEIGTPSAYARKMASNGFVATSTTQPMRNAVMNDELFLNHWFRRELSGGTTQGFYVTLHDTAPRYNSIPTNEAIDAFVRGLSDPSQGYDALLLRGEPAKNGLIPDVVFERGQEPALYLYLRARQRGAPNLQADRRGDDGAS